jgi:hypothetical protein
MLAISVCRVTPLFNRTRPDTSLSRLRGAEGEQIVDRQQRAQPVDQVRGGRIGSSWPVPAASHR